MSIKSVQLAAILLASVVSATACSSTSPPPTQGGSPSGQAAPELIAGSAVALSKPELNTANKIAAGSIAEVVGNKGYTFRLDFTMAPGQGSKSVTNSAPGRAAVTWAFPITFIATNTTSGRVSDIANIQGARVEAIWPAGSPLCSSENTNTDGSEGTYSWRTVTGPDGAAYCVGSLQNLSGTKGSIPVDGRYTVKADRNIDITVAEGDSQAVVDALTAGPVGWAIYNPGQSGACGQDAPLWVSAPVLGCTPAESGALKPAQASSLSTQALSKIKEILAGPQGAQPACPFGTGPEDFAVGMLPESLQAATWTSSPYSSTVMPSITGVDCLAGGMALSALDLAGVETTTFLANDKYAEWDEIQGPVDLAGGKAYFGADSINPESGKAYSITRFAWRSGDLLLNGKLVGSNTPQTYAWLKQNLAVMLTGIKA